MIQQPAILALRITRFLLPGPRPQLPGLRGVLWLVLLFTVTGCFRRDIRTFPVDVPQLNGETCFAIIQRALLDIEGVRDVQANYPARQIVVVFDTKILANKNVEYRLTEIGFEANGNAPNPAARALLPPACL